MVPRNSTRWCRPLGRHRHLFLAINHFLVHRHSVVGTYNGAWFLMGCVISIGMRSEGRAPGRRVGAGRETDAGPRSLTIDIIFPPFSFLSPAPTYRSASRLATCMICLVSRRPGPKADGLVAAVALFLYASAIRSCGIGLPGISRPSIFWYVRLCVPVPGNGKSGREPNLVCARTAHTPFVRMSSVFSNTPRAGMPLRSWARPSAGTGISGIAYVPSLR